METFNTRWDSSKFLWKLDIPSRSITRIENPRTREVYEDAYYRNVYFFSLSDAKTCINRSHKVRTYDGHFNTFPPLSAFTVYA